MGPVDYLREVWRVAGRYFILGCGVVFVLAISARWMVSPRSEPIPELTVAAYRTLMGKSGLGPLLFPLFERQCHCHVRVVTVPDGGALLTRLELDTRRGQFPIQVVLGLDQYLWSRARSYLESWDGWEPTGYQQIDSSLKMAPGFLPYDYGGLALMVDQKALSAKGLRSPRSVSDLLAPEWARTILLQDPRTATPGLTFLLFTYSVFGEKTFEFWKKLRTQWLTLAPSWDSSYSLFVKGEAPAVWSYLTSQAYHETHGEGARYRAVLFDEGQPFQVEAAALVRGSFQSAEQKKLARSFLEFLVSPEIQKLIPHTSWMMPVLPSTELPPDFLKLPQPVRKVWPDHDPETVRKVLEDWRRAVE